MVLPERLVRHEKIFNLCVAVSARVFAPGCKRFVPFLTSLLLCWGTRTLNVQEDTLSLLKAGICKKTPNKPKTLLLNVSYLLIN